MKTTLIGLAIGAALPWLAAAVPVAAQTAPAPAPAATPAPAYETRKVAENVYAFRYGGYQSLFVVTPAGVIAADPGGRGKPDAVKTYIAEIRKVTSAPIKYLVYTHSGYDHIAGGQPFKDLGATIVAHKNVNLLLERMNNAPDVVKADRVVGDGVTPLRLGGVTVNLVYAGPTRYPDSMLSLWLPREKVLFAADWIGVGAAPCLNTSCMPALWNYDAAIAKVLALDWTVFVPGHSGPGGRYGGKQDLERIREYMKDLNAYTGSLAADGKCNATIWESATVPAKYTDFVQKNVYSDHVERYCLAWNQGG